jgi:hypothetical protein
LVLQIRRTLELVDDLSVAAKTLDGDEDNDNKHKNDVVVATLAVSSKRSRRDLTLFLLLQFLVSYTSSFW